MPEDPFNLILSTSLGHLLPRSLHIAANLGIADLIEETPVHADDLAHAVGANPDALYRMLRLLATNGIFIMEGNAFAHNAASRLLRSDHPMSLRPFVRTQGFAINWDGARNLQQSIMTGKAAPTGDRAEPHWEYYRTHPEEHAIFNQAMQAKAHGQIAGVMAAYDFAHFGRIADIGGGQGHLLSAIAARYPAVEGTLFDLPEVIEGVVAAGARPFKVASGNFFHGSLPASDLYILMEVIHDWPDADAIRILRAVRRAAPAHATLLLIEQPLSSAPGPDYVKLVDMLMLMLFGAKQRTDEEYTTLLRTSGWAVSRILPTRGGVQIIEATL